MSPPYQRSASDLHGYWGEPTSTLDWCERNYEVSPFVAEFWNTLTNIVMIVTAMRGFYDVHNQGLEKRFHFCFASLFVVGIGSWMFHMTLQYEMQLLDELPMVWGGCILAYCMFEVQSPPCSKLSAAQGRGPNNKPLALILTLLATVFTLTHIYMKIPILHFITYGIIVISLATLDVQIMKSQYSRQLLCFYGLGLLLQLVAGLLWLIDNMVCEQLEATRQLGIIPTWLSPLTQLHGWWHVLAGYATYMHIIFCICHRQVYLKRACFLQPHYIFGYIIQRSADADSIEP